MNNDAALRNDVEALEPPCPQCSSLHVKHLPIINVPELKLGTKQKDHISVVDSYTCQNCGFQFAPEEPSEEWNLKQGISISFVVLIMIVLLLIVLL